MPLFQQPYVWNEELQWEPLWCDIERVSNTLLKSPNEATPHFIGAIVIQMQTTKVGDIPEYAVIDGQQRLTTLQILLDALHAQCVQVQALAPAARLEELVENKSAYCKHSDDRYKVWATNRDRPAFNEVMSAPSPVDYDGLEHNQERLVHAHRFFFEQSAEYIQVEGEGRLQDRANALERAVRELLQMVVIELNADENAQEIFEVQQGRDDCVMTSGLRHSSTQVLGVPSQEQKRPYIGRLSCDLRLLGWLRYTPLTLGTVSPTHTFENMSCSDRKEVPTGLLTVKIS